MIVVGVVLSLAVTERFIQYIGYRLALPTGRGPSIFIDLLGETRSDTTLRT